MSSGVQDKDCHKQVLVKFQRYYDFPDIMELEFKTLKPNKIH